MNKEPKVWALNRRCPSDVPPYTLEPEKSFKPGDLVITNTTVCEEDNITCKTIKGTIGLILAEPCWHTAHEGYLCKILIDGRVTEFNTIFLGLFVSEDQRHDEQINDR